MNRSDPVFVRERLRLANVWSKHRLGQHFLVDPKALDEILALSSIEKGETVIEIGPGLGVLTERLLEQGAVVHAFELDPAMLAILNSDFTESIQSGSLAIHKGDVLETLPKFLERYSGKYKIVANIPYQITTPLIQLFWQDGRLAGNRPMAVTLLVQKEVAERVTAVARDSDRGFLSFVVQYYSEATLGPIVPASSFWPAPEVDSAILTMKQRINRPLENDPEKEKQLIRFVRSSFLQRRKQLKNVLAGMRSLSVREVEDIFQEIGLPVTSRAQELREEDWLSLAAAIR